MKEFKPFLANVKATVEQLRSIGISESFAKDLLGKSVYVEKEFGHSTYRVRDNLGEIWAIDKKYVERVFDSLGVDSDKNQI